MHTRDFEYTDDDLIYADDDVKQKVYINYNSDLSGEIYIRKRRKGVFSENPQDFEEMKIPGWMLIDFIGEHISREVTSKLEGLTGGEVLKLLAGV